MFIPEIYSAGSLCSKILTKSKSNNKKVLTEELTRLYLSRHYKLTWTN